MHQARLIAATGFLTILALVPLYPQVKATTVPISKDTVELRLSVGVTER